MGMLSTSYGCAVTFLVNLKKNDSGLETRSHFYTIKEYM